MRLRVRVLVLAAALALGCERGGGERAAPPPAYAGVSGPATVRPDGTRASGRRGDRHARAASRRSRVVKRIEGKLARADGRLVVIRAPGAAPLTLRLAPGTTVTQGGRPAAIEALREGTEVRASYQTGGGGRPTAISIEAAPVGASAPAPAAEAGGGNWQVSPDPPPDGGG
jgi:hypothetical protein